MGKHKRPVKKRNSSVNSRYRSDNFQNMKSGLNISTYDKSANTTFCAGIVIPDETLKDITQTEGIGKRAIDIKTNDMVRQGFKVENDTDGLIVEAMEELDWESNYQIALRWAMGIGGGVIYMGVDDGQDADQPINKDNVKSVRFLKVYDKTEVTCNPSDFYEDTSLFNCGEPEIYTINSNGLTDELRIHESRILVFDGEPVTNDRRLNNDGWGDSIFQSIYQSLEALVVSWCYTYRIITDFRKLILKMPGLFDLIENNPKIVTNRLNALDSTSDIMQREVIDTTEELDYKSVSLAGISDLVKILETRYAAETGIPSTRLYGQSAQGLNSTGDNEEKIYYDEISSLQVRRLLKNLRTLATLIQLSKEGPTNGKEIPDWKITFLPLFQEPQEQIVKNRKLQSEIDKIYIEHSVLSEQEIRDARFGGAEYSYDISIDSEFDVTNDPEDDDEDNTDA